jgi:hypothetical protein
MSFAVGVSEMYYAPTMGNTNGERLFRSPFVSLSAQLLKLIDHRPDVS